MPVMACDSDPLEPWALCVESIWLLYDQDGGRVTPPFCHGVALMDRWLVWNVRLALDRTAASVER